VFDDARHPWRLDFGAFFSDHALMGIAISLALLGLAWYRRYYCTIYTDAGLSYIYPRFAFSRAGYSGI